MRFTEGRRPRPGDHLLEHGAEALPLPWVPARRVDRPWRPWIFCGALTLPAYRWSFGLFVDEAAVPILIWASVMRLRASGSSSTTAGPLFRGPGPGASSRQAWVTAASGRWWGRGGRPAFPGCGPVRQAVGTRRQLLLGLVGGGGLDFPWRDWPCRRRPGPRACRGDQFLRRAVALMVPASCCWTPINSFSRPR